jgi:hypothetical protein
VITATRTGLVVTASDAELQALRDRFAREHILRLSGFLDAAHVELIDRYIDEVGFLPRVHEGIGTELCLPEGRAVRLLFFLVNDPALFAVIERITGCSSIGCFTGRLYRMLPGRDDFDTWHSDAIQNRMVGMSVNLGPPYEGGVFQLRDRPSQRMLGEAPNVGVGDAILFRIDKNLEHWITPLSGTEPKTAFAGWFRSSPQFLTLLEREGETEVEPEW